VYPINLEFVDFLAADAHKWMLGPCAAGLMYVRKAVQDFLKPTVFGWHNVRCPDFIAQETLNHPPDARRYEAGSFNISGYCGMKASMELLLEVGIENIATELLRKRNLLIPRLQELGWNVLSTDAPPKNQSGIVSFRRDGIDLRTVHSKLQECGIDISLRTDRERNHYLRVSAHFYNTDGELDRLVQALSKLG
jgi:selenocysteine lyase/cysteine desulfurase